VANAGEFDESYRLNVSPRNWLLPSFVLRVKPVRFELCIDHHRVVRQPHHAADAGVNACAQLACFGLGDQVAMFTVCPVLTTATAAAPACCFSGRVTRLGEKRCSVSGPTLWNSESPRREISRDSARGGTPPSDAESPTPAFREEEPLARAAGLDCTQTFLGSRSSGHAYRLHRLHSQQ